MARSTQTWGPWGSFSPPRVGGASGTKQIFRESLSVCTPEHTQTAGPFPACTARLRDLLTPSQESGVLPSVYMTLGQCRVTDNLNSGGLLLSGFCFKHRILLPGFDCPELKILLGTAMEDDGWTPPYPVGGATRAGTESQQSRASCRAVTASGGSSLLQGRGFPFREQTHPSEG